MEVPVRLKSGAAFFLILIFTNLMCRADGQNIRHTPWELIIYRPENGGDMNEVRCWLKIEDENGNDVTKTAAKAEYEWASIPGKKYKYRRDFYLSGGMAAHINIKSGKYRISVYTPKNSQYPYNFETKDDWVSNSFSYNTENPAKVIFVVPTANENGFYNGGWFIDYKCPEWFKFTKPARNRNN